MVKKWTFLALLVLFVYLLISMVLEPIYHWNVNNIGDKAIVGYRDLNCKKFGDWFVNMITRGPRGPELLYWQVQHLFYAFPIGKKILAGKTHFPLEKCLE